MRSIERRRVPGLLVLLLAGCTKLSTPPDAAPSRSPPTLCAQQALSREELSGILTSPLIADQAVPGDPQSCRYLTQGFPSITLSARPGAGRATLEAWTQGRVPLAATPVAGLGEGALWQESLHELIAQDHDLLCDVQVTGTTADLVPPAAALPARLAQLCRMLFSRL